MYQLITGQPTSSLGGQYCFASSASVVICKTPWRNITHQGGSMRRASSVTSHQGNTLFKPNKITAIAYNLSKPQNQSNYNYKYVFANSAELTDN